MSPPARQGRTNCVPIDLGSWITDLSDTLCPERSRGTSRRPWSRSFRRRTRRPMPSSSPQLRKEFQSKGLRETFWVRPVREPRGRCSMMTRRRPASPASRSRCGSSNESEPGHHQRHQRCARSGEAASLERRCCRYLRTRETKIRAWQGGAKVDLSLRL